MSSCDVNARRRASTASANVNSAALLAYADNVLRDDRVTPAELPRAHALYIDPRGPGSPGKVEALYLHLGRGAAAATYYSAGTPAYYGTGREDAGFAVVRAGLNYRF